jgi:hypothetical protein
MADKRLPKIITKKVPVKKRRKERSIRSWHKGVEIPMWIRHLQIGQGTNRD